MAKIEPVLYILWISVTNRRSPLGFGVFGISPDCAGSVIDGVGVFVCVLVGVILGVGVIVGVILGVGV